MGWYGYNPKSGNYDNVASASIPVYERSRPNYGRYGRYNRKGKGKGKTTTTVSIPRVEKVSTELKITMEKPIGDFIRKMMELKPRIEWGCVFTFIVDNENGIAHIDELYMLPVTTSAGDVHYINESTYGIYDSVSELSKFASTVYKTQNSVGKERKYAGIIHSHHNMSAYHSGTDTNNIRTWLNDFGAVMSIVVAKKIGSDIITRQTYIANTESHENNTWYEAKPEKTFIPPKQEEKENVYLQKYLEMEKMVLNYQDMFERYLEKFRKEKTFKYSKAQELFLQLIDEYEYSDNDDMKEIIIETASKLLIHK